MSQKIDVWAMGLMLFELRYGENVSHIVNGLSSMNGIRNRHQFYLSHKKALQLLTSASSNALDHTIASMLSLDSSQRPSSELVRKIVAQELGITESPDFSEGDLEWISKRQSLVQDVKNRLQPDFPRNNLAHRAAGLNQKARVLQKPFSMGQDLGWIAKTVSRVKMWLWS